MTAFKKILLAEDDEDDQMIFTEIVKKLYPDGSLRFDVVDNGMEVMEALENAPELPDLLILDQNMPQLNGKETLEMLKKDDRFQSIPVVIYSTYNDNRLSNECLTIGAKQIITKPDSIDEFRDMVVMLVEKYLQQSV